MSDLAKYAGYLTDAERSKLRWILASIHPDDVPFILKLLDLFVESPPKTEHERDEAMNLVLDYAGGLVGLAVDVEVSEEEARAAEAIVERINSIKPTEEK